MSRCDLVAGDCCLVAFSVRVRAWLQRTSTERHSPVDVVKGWVYYYQEGVSTRGAAMCHKCIARSGVERPHAVQDQAVDRLPGLSSV